MGGDGTIRPEYRSTADGAVARPQGPSRLSAAPAGGAAAAYSFLSHAGSPRCGLCGHPAPAPAETACAVLGFASAACPLRGSAGAPGRTRRPVSAQGRSTSADVRARTVNQVIFRVFVLHIGLAREPAGTIRPPGSAYGGWPRTGNCGAGFHLLLPRSRT